MTKEEAKKEFNELLKIQNELKSLREQQNRAMDNTEFDSEIQEQERDRSEEMRRQFVDRYKHYLEKYDRFKNQLTDEDFSEKITFGADKFDKTYGIVQEKDTILLNETHQKVSRKNVNFPEM